MQPLLFPLTLDLTPAQMAIWQENAAIFAESGFEAEPFGGNTLLIHGVPAGLGTDHVARLVSDFLDRLQEDQVAPGTPVTDRRRRVLAAMAACKAAIKARDALQPEDIAALLSDLAACASPETCPHGRPTIICVSSIRTGEEVQAVKLPLLVLVGPTAVGKTALSVAVAQAVGAEIISGDSMQVYRGMDIGTAKIRPEEMGGVPHHLIDIKDPDEDFSVAEFQARVDELIPQICARGRLPMLVGGTGLYVRAVVEKYTFTPMEADHELGRGSGRRRSGTGPGTCTPGSGRWIRPPPHGSTPTTSSASCGRWRSTSRPACPFPPRRPRLSRAPVRRPDDRAHDGPGAALRPHRRAGGRHAGRRLAGRGARAAGPVPAHVRAMQALGTGSWCSTCAGC